MMKLFCIMTVLLLSSCSTTDLKKVDICPWIELPGSGDGYCKTMISHKKKRMPKDEFAIYRKRLMGLSSKDFAKVKKAFLKHCISSQCKQTVGAFDELFLTIDKAAQVGAFK